MNLINLLSGPINGPYIYFILIDDYIYIGETQKHPVIRWGAHLTAGGTFLKKINEQSINYENKDLLSHDITFISINCSTLFGKNDAGSKILCQALEHNLHCVVKSNPSLFGWSKVVVSDTEKTAPRRFNNWSYIEVLSHKILGKVIEALT